MKKGEGIQICTVDGCDKKHNAKGMCAMHYARLKKNGTLEAPKPRPTLEERFWAKVDQSGECWLWTSQINRGGYGVLHAPQVSGGENETAHRVSYFLTRGNLPEGMFIDHICHTKACVRPSHLRAVTPKQNCENRGGLSKANTSGAHGVTWDKRKKVWLSYVRHEGKSYYLGAFHDRDEAAQAAQTKRNRLFTHNDIDRQQQQDAA